MFCSHFTLYNMNLVENKHIRTSRVTYDVDVRVLGHGSIVNNEDEHFNIFSFTLLSCCIEPWVFKNICLTFITLYNAINQRTGFFSQFRYVAWRHENRVENKHVTISPRGFYRRAWGYWRGCRCTLTRPWCGSSLGWRVLESAWERGPAMAAAASPAAAPPPPAPANQTTHCWSPSRSPSRPPAWRSDNQCSCWMDVFQKQLIKWRSIWYVMIDSSSRCSSDGCYNAWLTAHPIVQATVDLMCDWQLALEDAANDWQLTISSISISSSSSGGKSKSPDASDASSADPIDSSPYASLISSPNASSSSPSSSPSMSPGMMSPEIVSSSVPSPVFSASSSSSSFTVTKATTLHIRTVYVKIYWKKMSQANQ